MTGGAVQVDATSGGAGAERAERGGGAPGGGAVPTVLLTGFEPFEQQEVNASWAAVRAVADSWDQAAEGAALVTALLPVSFARAPRRLAELLLDVRPSLVVAVGEAGGRANVSVERVAVNVQDARIPDEDGAQPVDVPVVPGGDAAHFSSLPIKACLAALREAGVPGEVSNTAGTFVCNTIAYALADQLAAGHAPGARGGFVHVPRLPEQVPARAASLGVEGAAEGLRAVLRAALRTTEDVTLAAGTLS
ncbi:pyroglutamyl-peptidase I [Cellulomonas pakistanensis]|uniref:Pyroglutamyl-peptidase I n=1 Tax=Cellulomonas pakistanensis TaxID=992287 RepID=A0A919PBI5_9CELL|nr:pyroglutamyl-peptidase I [Cellulomonas pakistanensis]GIG37506.1 pyrrolidone-carboxylate peptidase [Cellulomonas pakistanensis]